MTDTKEPAKSSSVTFWGPGRRAASKPFVAALPTTRSTTTCRSSRSRALPPSARSDAKLDIVTLAAEPARVLLGRVDHFTMNDGRKLALPVTGVFEVKNGKSGMKL